MDIATHFFVNLAISCTETNSVAYTDADYATDFISDRCCCCWCLASFGDVNARRTVSDTSQTHGIAAHARFFELCLFLQLVVVMVCASVCLPLYVLVCICNSERMPRLNTAVLSVSNVMIAV